MAIFSLWDKEFQNKGIKNTEELRKQETNNTNDENRRGRGRRENIEEIPINPVYERLSGTKVIDGKVYESISPDLLNPSDEKILDKYVYNLSTDNKAKQSLQDDEAINHLLARSEADQKMLDMQRWITDFDQSKETIRVVEDGKKKSTPSFLNSIKIVYQNWKSKLFRSPVRT